MLPEESVIVSVKDNYSQVISTLSNITRAFSKDITGMQQRLDTLNRNKVTLRIDTTAAEKGLKSAERAFTQARSNVERLQKQMDSFKGDRTGREFERLEGQLKKANAAFADSKQKVEGANVGYEQARRNLALVSQEAEKTEKSMDDLAETDRRMGNRLNTSALQELMSNSGALGILGMVKNVLSGTANAMVSSAGGQEVGAIFSNALSGAMTGAVSGFVMGTQLGIVTGPVGAIIGGTAGTVLGAASGVLENIKNQDEAFKTYISNQYDARTQGMATSLESGSAIAGTRETDLVALTALIREAGVDLSATTPPPPLPKVCSAWASPRRTPWKTLKILAVRPRPRA